MIRCNYFPKNEQTSSSEGRHYKEKVKMPPKLNEPVNDFTRRQPLVDFQLDEFTGGRKFQRGLDVDVPSPCSPKSKWRSFRNPKLIGL
jgi:hypothetical protein